MSLPGHGRGARLDLAQGGTLGAPILRFLHALARADKPLVAAVNGRAVGVGTTMLLHCDHVVASDTAVLSAPFVALGLVPEAASSLIAPRLMGHARAFALLVMGQPLNAAEAKEAGIVNAVVPAADLETQALAAARTMAALPAQKPVSCPAMSTQRMLARCAASSIACAIASYIASVSAFFFSGRFIRTVRTGPSSLTRMSGMGRFLRSD